MNATGGAGAVHLTDPRPARSRRRLAGAGAEHGALPLRRGRGPLHPHLRPARLADVGVGPRRRRADERPADRHADRLPRVDPDPARGLHPEEEGDPLCESGHLPAEDQADIETLARAVGRGRHVRHATARRCSTSTSPAAPTAAPAATPRAGATASPACPARARSAGTSPAAATNAHFPNQAGHDRVRLRRVGATASATARRRRAAAACPAFGALLTDEQIEAIVEYVRGL